MAISKFLKLKQKFLKIKKFKKIKDQPEGWAGRFGLEA